MGTSFDSDELIADVIQMITAMQGIGMDPLDANKFVVGLEEKFGTGVVQQAIYLLEKKKKRVRSQPTDGEPDPLWDRELDG